MVFELISSLVAISAADVPYDDTTIQSVILNDGSPLTYDEQLSMLGDRPNLQCTFRRCSSLIREAQSANPDLVEIIPALSHISLHDQQAKLAGVEYLVDTLVYFSKETN